ncbi:Kelch repeat-containing protein [Zobellia uliginosa]|uniref:Kelch repeat-containing protein n=1 Tax=Zobellia uliginosa TaxID=143224 RepID=UPI0026E119D8|nr:kelch repeat-containing protein [Zobellia uliginosa]MDO6517926.1 kelch repeat-containing protein [Zobellia uliginosa]
MKFKDFFLICLSLVIFNACSDDDVQIDSPEEDTGQPQEEVPNEEEEGSGNTAPVEFSLAGLEDGASDIDLHPVLSWTATTDTDGDEITYTLLLDTNESPETILAENLTATEFTIAEGLDRNKVYYWKVIASDGKGGETESSETFSFSTKGFSFADSALTTNVGFGARRNHSITEFNGKLWMIGGRDDIDSYDDIWSSTDGETWQLEAEDPFGFFNKSNHTAVVFKNKLWVIAGAFSDVWSSTNGKDWTKETTNPGFGSREGHSTVVYDGKLWVIGGTKVSDQMNDVWYSENGIHWVQATESAQFSPRTDHTTVVFDGKMYLMGGTAVQDSSPIFYNDVYTSTDGVNWTEVDTDSVFELRANHTSLVYGNRMWVIGGWQAIVNQSTFQQDITTFADVWYSDNGTHWNKLTTSASYGARMGHVSVIFDDKILISGGLKINQEDHTRAHNSDVWMIE